ncbi:homeobox-leucine zipper protein HDG11 [Tanacetum coccineum]
MIFIMNMIEDVADKDSDSIPVDLDPLTIVLASCHKLLDAAVRSTATSCPLLESLDMSNFLCVSDETLREITPICGHLHILNASYCPNISLEIDQGTWVIAELSHVRAPNTYRRLPSGCLIEHITGDVSKVTWVEHMEVDEPLPNKSGFAFRAERIVAWLERSCERGSHMNATCHNENPCYEGKEKKMLAFYEDIVVGKDESGQ